MGGGKAAASLLGVLLPGCFMGNYDLLQIDRDGADASANAGADGGLLDAAPSADAMRADASPPAPACDTPDAAAPSCGEDLCPPVLPTAVCQAQCQWPWCDPCVPCLLSCEQDGCAANCQPGRNCIYKCPSGVACKSICAAGATCNMECRDAKSCDLTCEAGSTCTIHCRDSERCAVTCKPGAHCALGCFDANAVCEFAECSGQMEQCGGAAFCDTFGCAAR